MPNLLKLLDLCGSLQRSSACSKLSFVRRHKSGRVKRVFSADEQLHIGLQLVAGLRHIHVNNVAHCDVKLANVLVFPGQRCKLCDFGIAERVVDGRISRNFLL